MKRTGCVMRAAVAIASSVSGFAASAAEYSPEEAMSVMYESMRIVLGFPEGGSSAIWLSLSMVGELVDSNDSSQINDLANFCPDPSPVITSYSRVRRLDAIYGKTLDSLTGPTRNQSAKYNTALEVLRTPKYVEYNAYSDRYNGTYAEYLLTRDPAVRRRSLDAINRIENDWLIFGYRREIEDALATIKSENVRYSAINNNLRSRVLASYRSAGLAPSDVPGAFKSPASELSPRVEGWTDTGGWVKVTYSDNDTKTAYSSSNSQKRGFGGLSLSFVTLGGSRGAGGGNESRVEKVSSFTYEYELKRVLIRRPWLDTDVFFEPTAWTWKKAQNTPNYPRIAISPDAAGKPQESDKAIYDNTTVACPLLPLELVVARNRTLTATVQRTDYERIVSSGSSGRGGGAFGLFGGSRKTWTATKISESDNMVTFRIDAPGVAVIGMISQSLPESPNPNMKDRWPQEAWLPSN